MLPSKKYDPFVFALIASLALAVFFTTVADAASETPRPGIVLGEYPAGARTPTAQQNARCMKAFRLYRRGVINRIVVTGGYTRDHISEARMMKITLVAFGVPQERIIEEPRAGTTVENAKFASMLFDRLGWEKKAFIISQSYHLMRAKPIFRSAGFKVKTAFANPAPTGKEYEMLETVEPPGWIGEAPGAAVVFEDYHSDEPLEFPSPALALRLRTAAKLYRDGIIHDVTVYNDWYTRGHVDIAEMMQVALVALGVSARDIDLLSHDHYSRFERLPKLLKDEREPVILITSSEQKKRVTPGMSGWRLWFIDAPQAVR